MFLFSPSCCQFGLVQALFCLFQKHCLSYKIHFWHFSKFQNIYCDSLIISRVSLVCRNRNFSTFHENSTFQFLKFYFYLSDCNTGFLLFSGFFIYSLCALIFCSFFISLTTSFFIIIQESKLLVAKILCKTLCTGVMLSITRFINNSVFVSYLAKPKFYVCFDLKCTSVSTSIVRPFRPQS